RPARDAHQCFQRQLLGRRQRRRRRRVSDLCRGTRRHRAARHRISQTFRYLALLPSRQRPYPAGTPHHRLAGGGLQSRQVPLVQGRLRPSKRIQGGVYGRIPDPSFRGLLDRRTIDRMNKSAAKRMKQRSAGKPDIELGKRIRLRRVEQKISQAELGEKLGVSFQQVQKYEKGVNRVGAARLQQIANALDVPVTFFYDGDNKAREVESLLFLDSAFSLRLLRAYSKIKDQTVQRQLVSLMESIAANED